MWSHEECANSVRTAPKVRIEPRGLALSGRSSTSKPLLRCCHWNAPECLCYCLCKKLESCWQNAEHGKFLLWHNVFFNCHWYLKLRCRVCLWLWLGFLQDLYSVPRTILPHGASFHGHPVTISVICESSKDSFTVEVSFVECLILYFQTKVLQAPTETFIISLIPLTFNPVITMVF